MSTFIVNLSSLRLRRPHSDDGLLLVHRYLRHFQMQQLAEFLTEKDGQ